MRLTPLVQRFSPVTLLGVFLSVAGCTSSPPPAPPPPATAEADARATISESDSSATSAAAAFAAERVWGEGTAMGTHLGFAAYTNPNVDAAKAKELFQKAIDEIKRIEFVMTTWRPDSELSRVNAAAGKGAVEVSDETLRVVKEAIHTSEISEGTFDITFESLHGLWKFDQDLDPHPPKADELKKKLPLVNFHHIKIDDAKKTIALDKEGVKISLGGIAKGYAVDKAAAVLEAGGLQSFYVQAGGDLYARGKKPDGADWSAGIRDPRSAKGAYFAVLPLSDHAFSTAGDYERSYIVDGKRYHHIIDPRTGYPATACRSVTIWAKSALIADSIDDAVFILGPAKGMKLVESLDDVGAVIVDKDNNVHISKRLQGKLSIVAAPTEGI